VIESSSFVIVLTTFPVDGDAESFARTLVDEQLVACVNVLAPMQSLYRWQGTVEEANERQLVMKTSAASVEALKTRIARLHPYDVPEILVIAVTGGGEAYLRWIAESTPHRRG
jgi:periplasmic divalent cation tolerance protein